MSLAQMVLSGVFDRLPDLRIFFAETRLGWVPFWMEEADYWYERHRHWAERLLHLAPLAQRPSDYVRRHVFFSVQHVERVAVELRHHMGVDRIMFATDFPHIECDWPEHAPVRGAPVQRRALGRELQDRRGQHDRVLPPRGHAGGASAASRRKRRRADAEGSDAMIQARKLGHVVLKVRDAQKSQRFLRPYSRPQGIAREPRPRHGVPELRRRAPRAGAVPARHRRDAGRRAAGTAPHGLAARKLRRAARRPSRAQRDGHADRGHHRAQRDPQHLRPRSGRQPRRAVLRHGRQRIRGDADARPPRGAAELRVGGAMPPPTTCPLFFTSTEPFMFG